MTKYQMAILKPIQYPELLRLAEAFEITPGFSWTSFKIEEELKVSVAWGLWVSETLWAFVLWRETSDAFEIMALGTDPSSRRQGAMGTLLKHLIAGCQKSIWLEVHEFNLSAIKLYQDLGFQRSGMRKNYYSDGAAAVLMTFLRKDF